MASDASQPTSRAGARPRADRSRPFARGWRRGLLAGGTDGNERLTVLTGLVLIVLFAAVGVTIIWIGQLLWLHLFLGLVLLGPIALKLCSTGYRLTRYYTADPAYRKKGPPAPALRGLAPLLVLLTLMVFATGVALLVLGPVSRQPLVLLHKLSFFVWIAVAALHVLGHLPQIRRVLSSARATRRDVLGGHAPIGQRAPRVSSIPGRTGREAALAVAVLGGSGLAVALIGQFAVWTH